MDHSALPPTAHALLTALRGSASVLITGPVEPDGDSIGACLALQILLEHGGVKADVAGVPSYRYRWMPGVERMLPDHQVEAVYDAVVVLDGDRHRLTPQAAAAFEAARFKGIIDHHASTRSDGYTAPWIDASATSTCEMLYSAVQAIGFPVDRTLAELLYVGAIYDTGGFRYSNTTPATHRMAAELLASGIDHAAICTRVLMERRVSGLRLAGHVYSTTCYAVGGKLALGEVTRPLMDELGFVEGDLEGVVDALVHTMGVEVAALLVERSPGQVKASLRSRGRVDVAEVAQRLSTAGGGHAKAAGANLTGPRDEVRARITATVADALGAPTCSG